jgi:hypothetical protein
MRARTVLLVMLTLTAAALFAKTPDPRAPLLGTWSGTSLCTDLWPACHDEHVVYHIKPAPAGDVVTIDANKIIDGKELFMGSLDCRVDFPAQVMRADYDSGRVKSHWEFRWSGREMRGTASSDGKVGRNIKVSKN